LPWHWVFRCGKYFGSSVKNGDANKNISPQIVDFQPLRQGIFLVDW
jgi:hypothetical protein